MFNFQIDKKYLYIILAVMVILSLAGYITNTNALVNLLLTIPGVLIAITFHEFAHAFAADKLGDDTPKRQGRLTLNPIAHLDPVGSIMLLFAHFGWGKPVEVNTRNFTRKISMSAAEAIVAIAGPLMNILLAIVFTIIYFVLLKFATAFVLYNQIGSIIVILIQTTIIINIGLGIFNLIPLPPLDGSKVLKSFLPYKAKEWMETYSQYFYYGFLILWITGLAGSIVSPIISIVYSGIINLVGMFF